MSNSKLFSGGKFTGKVPEKSTYVQTCNLLSRYVKEKGSLRDLNIEIGGRIESLESIVRNRAPSATMNFLGDMEKSGHESIEKDTTIDFFSRPSTPDSVGSVEDASKNDSTSKEATAMDTKSDQLTIFYGGRVMVFDDYPTDKANELVQFATKESSHVSYGVLLNIGGEKTKSGAGSHSVASGSAGEAWRSLRQEADGKEKMKVVTSCYQPKQHALPTSEASGSDLPIARRSSLHRFLEKRKDRTVARGPYQMQEQRLSSYKSEKQFELNF